MLFIKRTKILIFLMAVLLVVVMFNTVIKAFNKPQIDVKKAETELRINSNELIHSFISDETKADSSFVERVIEVEGIVEKITFKNEKTSIILQTQIDSSNIICEMRDDDYDRLAVLKEGEEVIVKGVCKGFLMDVIILNCIFVPDE